MTSSTKKNFFFSTLLLSFLLFMGACDTELEPDDNNQSSNPNSPVSVDPEKASEYLKLVNATKITGKPPEGVACNIWIDVKDTIFLVRGLPVGDRVSFLHDPALKITGFYVYVPGSSYYYDIPSLPEEGRDSTDVLYIDAGFPVVDFKDYPISFLLHIMPHVNGIPCNTFIKPVKIEDPGEAHDCNSILQTGNSGEGNRIWEWEFTIRKYKGDILNFWAPGITVSVNSLLGGCCRDDGVSFFNGDSGCSKIDSLRSPRYTWVEFPSYDGRTSLFDLLWLDSNGTFGTRGNRSTAQIISNTRDFCTQTVDLLSSVSEYNTTGTHDYTLGASRMTLQFPGAQLSSVSFLDEYTYDLAYTCKSLVLTRGSSEGEEWGYVYKKLPEDFDEQGLFDFHPNWFDKDNHKR